MDSTRFLASVKRRAYLPDSGSEYDDASILAVAQESTTEVMLPSILGVREAFLQRRQIYPIVTPLLVDGIMRSAYTTPTRASGGAVSIVRYQDTSGRLWPLTRIDDAQKQWSPQMQSSVSWFSVWYFDGPDIILQPAAPTGGISGAYISVTYTARPNNLSSDAKIQQVTYSVGTPGTIAVASTTGYLKDDVIDIVAFDGLHEWRMFGAVVSSVVDATHLTIDGLTANTGVKTGDWLCPQDSATPGQWLTKIPMLPDEMHTLLVLETARRILDDMSDPRAANLALELYGDGGKKIGKLAQVTSMISPRATNQPLHIVNRFSALRIRNYGGGWGGRW